MNDVLNNRLDYVPDDGYTEPGYIQAAPGIHGEFRFTFRPTLVEQQSQMVAAGEHLKAEKYDQKTAQFLAEKLVSWSLLDRRKQPVAVSAKVLLQLKPKLFTRLFAIVVGFDASDVDPQWERQVQQEHVEEELQSALTDKPVGAVREEREAKNSSTG